MFGLEKKLFKKEVKKMTVILDKYSGKGIDRDVNKVAKDLTGPVAGKVTEKIYDNLSANKNTKLI